MSTEAMIDIETFDTKDTAVIFQIGIVIFGEGGISGELIHLAVQPQLDIGRTISASTLKFWLNPEISGVAYESLGFARPPSPGDKYAKHPETALAEVHSRLSGIQGSIWAKGSFDFVLLEHMFRQYSLIPPWMFYQCRDLRTLMKECDVPKHDNISHNALDDCQHQLEQLLECRKRIRLGVDAMVDNDH